MASGTVVVKSHKKTIQHLDGGVVSQLLVANGDIVNEGDLLLSLDGTENRAQLEIARSQYISLTAQATRLEAELNNQTSIDFPQELLTDDDPRITTATRTESQLFTARKNRREGELAVMKQRVAQLQSLIQGLKDQRKNKQVLVDSYAREEIDLEDLLAKGFTNKQRLLDIQRNHTQNNGEIAGLNSDIAANQLKIGETNMEIIQLEKKFQEEVSTQLIETQAKLSDVNQRIIASSNKVTRIDIKAPVSGRVMGLAVHTLGGVILPGHPILDIVPLEDELIVDVQVSPLDIDRVTVGLVVEVRFPAFKQALTPVVQGKVITLSADSLMNEKNNTPYYQAEIELTPDSKLKMSKLELVPGMPVEVLINTGQRTVFEYLVQPISNSLAKAFRED
jgi:epimerase transport system membrane fusion protein